MKISIPLVLISAISLGADAMVNSNKDAFHFMRQGTMDDGSMWIFGGDGLDIYSPDGSKHFRHTPATEVCHNTTGYKGSAPALSCSFYDVVSDGKKYVWGAVSRGVPKIDVFDIDTGATVGSFETCRGPRDLEYHALRDEIWVRCMGTNSEEVHDETETYMDVFSASSPGADIVTNVMVKDNSTLSAYGYSVIENSLGDVGYTTVWNDNKLFKIDLSEKKVLEKFELPLAYGVYEVAYSAKNQHIFARATVCCSCGFEGADLLDCGRYGSSEVLIKTGQFAGQVKQGTCGRCDGIAGVDTLGVYEFDTVSEEFVGNHLMPAGVGGDPFSSPDGEYIILVGRNGGERLRFLKTGANGQQSAVAFDLELGFDFSGEEDSAVYNDFAFVQTHSDRGDKVYRDMILIASGTENKVALVDMRTGSPQVTTISLSTSPELTARRNRRQVEWVRGTKYVWIDGTDTDEGEVYVVNIDTKKVERTISGIKTTKMLNVENFERKQVMARMENLVAQRLDTLQDDKPKEDTNTNTGTTDASRSQSQGQYNDDNDVDGVGIVALLTGLVACVIGVANMLFLKKAMAGLGSEDKFDDDGRKSLTSSKIPV